MHLNSPVSSRTPVAILAAYAAQKHLLTAVIYALGHVFALQLYARDGRPTATYVPFASVTAALEHLDTLTPRSATVRRIYRPGGPPAVLQCHATFAAAASSVHAPGRA